jgi:hypothetical protein
MMIQNEMFKGKEALTLWDVFHCQHKPILQGMRFEGPRCSSCKTCTGNRREKRRDEMMLCGLRPKWSLSLTCQF